MSNNELLDMSTTTEMMCFQLALSREYVSIDLRFILAYDKPWPFIKQKKKNLSIPFQNTILSFI